MSGHWIFGNKRRPLEVLRSETINPRGGRSVLIIVSVISGLIFLFLAGLNPWIMLTNRASSERSGRLWIRVHRTVGYLFIAVFAITVYFMLLRLKGESDELPPRILLHMSLALMLAPCCLLRSWSRGISRRVHQVCFLPSELRFLPSRSRWLP